MIRIFPLIALATLLVGAPLPAQEDLDELEEQSMKAAVAVVAPSVVQIETFGGLEQVGGLLVGSGPTTGLVVSEDGYILSSAFNFVQQPSSILVTLPDGKRAAAEIVARDRSRMLVLLKVHTDQKLVIPEVVPREEMRVGQWAIAVGRTFAPDSVNMSVGVLSATNRIWSKALQTDAKVSPSNYGGPLIDIRGRVLGILVPLSPDGESEVAGNEWYDSGIGFAIPLVDIQKHLDLLKSGEDLRPGLLGIGLKGENVFRDPPVLAAIHPRSPAAAAGLKVGDRIVRVGEVAVDRESQLKHLLGPLYAGDRVALAVERDGQTIEVEVELVGELEPYEYAFLGFLPQRDGADQGGLGVRYVYPDSGAAEAGLQVGDRVLAVGEQPLDAATIAERIRAAQETVARAEPGQQLTITIEREGEKQSLDVKLATLPTELPESLPPAHAEAEAAAGQIATGIVEIRIPEEPNRCVAYVPTTYRENVPHGLVVWLPTPGAFNQEELEKRWKELCERHELIVLAPQAQNPDAWEPTEILFVRKAIDAVRDQYEIDPTRVVAHGHQAGGSMAYLLAFTTRSVLRGVAVSDATIPRRAPIGDTDPLNRLAILATVPQESQQTQQIRENLQELEKRKFPVTQLPRQAATYLEADELEQLARWIDALDRI